MRTPLKDKKYLGRDLPADLEIVQSTDNFLIDSNGVRYIDFIMGWCVGNLDWGKKEVFDRIKKFNGPEYVLPGLFVPSVG